MWGRMGRAAGVYGALSLVWWASIELAYTAIDCEDWDCLYSALASVLGITVAVLAVAWRALRLVKVQPAGRTATVAAVLVLLFVLTQWLGLRALDEWPDSVVAVLEFAPAGAVGAFVTDRGIARRYRALVLGAVVALVPLTFTWVMLTGTW